MIATEPRLTAAEIDTHQFRNRWRMMTDIAAQTPDTTTLTAILVRRGRQWARLAAAPHLCPRCGERLTATNRLIDGGYRGMLRCERCAE